MKQSQISLRIKQLMKEKGISMCKLAKLMEKDLASVSRWVNGKGNMTVKTIEMFEKVLEGEIITVSI